VADDQPQTTVFEAVGGEPAFRHLVATFYAGVREDPILRPLYPDEDLAAAQERLTLFLMQYWGGPSTYGDTRGHPRLRMRHAPFAIDAAARDAWLTHMRAALDTLELPEALDDALWDHVYRGALMLVNSPGAEPPRSLPTVP